MMKQEDEQVKFLIVDDNPADRELVIRSLRRVFADADFIEIGQRADFETALAAGDFDFVLSDYYLHWDNGLNIFRRIRERYPKVPVVMFTDSGNEEVAVQGMKLGLSDYLHKQHLGRLPIAVQEGLNRRQMRQEQERLQRELEQSEARYQAISELATDFAFAYRVLPDGRGACEWITDAFARMTGYSSEDLDPVEGWLEVVHPDDAKRARAQWAHVMQGETVSQQYRILTRSGEARWLQVVLRPELDGAGEVVRVYGAAQDITERRAAEVALRQSEARFRTLFSSAAVGIALVDTERRILAANPALVKMLGYKRDTLYGRSFNDITYAEDAEMDLQLFQELARGERASYDLQKRYVRADGEVIWAHLSVSRAVDESGSTDFVIKMIQDITEQKAAQEALVQAEKLRVTGTLAASLAHEINNPMQAVIGCVTLAREALRDIVAACDDQTAVPAGEADELLQMAHGELLRAARIVTELRDLQRPSDPRDRKPVDIREVIERALDLSEPELGKTQVTVVWDHDGDELPKVRVVADRLHQVFLNLILNARDAMPDGGELVITATPTDDPPGVRVSFADNGGGIPDEIRVKLFTPFMTTKERGVGLGLYVCHNIIEEHSGAIDVETEPGEGTKFHIWLPADAAA